MVGTTHVGGDTPVYYLGTGTSFDVSGIPGYQNLTANNFIIGGLSASSSSGGKVPYKDDVSLSLGGFSLGKKYNATTGKLTISGNSYSSSASSSSGGSASASTSIKTFAYLIKGDIKSL